MTESRYRVTVFGEPRGPWHEQRRLACQDAIDLGLGSYDERGRFFVSVPAEIDYELRCLGAVITPQGVRLG